MTRTRGDTVLLAALVVLGTLACDGRTVQPGVLFDDGTGFQPTIPDYFIVGRPATIRFSTAARPCDAHGGTRVRYRELDVTVEPFDRISNDLCDLALVTIPHEAELMFPTWGTAHITIIGRDTAVTFEREVALEVSY